MKVILNQLFRLKKEMALNIITALISAFFSMSIPGLTKQLIDVAIPSADYELIIYVAGKMFIFALIIAFVGIYGARCSAYISSSVGKNMREAIFNKVQSFSEIEIDKFTTSSLISRTNSDITQVELFLGLCLRTAIICPIYTIVGVVMTIITARKLVMILVVAVPLMILAIILIGLYCIPLATKLQLKLDTINMIIREKLTGVRVIRAFGTTEFENKKFDNVNKEYSIYEKKIFLGESFLRLVAIIGNGLTMVVVLVIPYFQYLNGDRDYTIGMLISVITYISLIMIAVLNLTLVLLFLPKVAVCASRANEVIDEVPSIDDPKEPKEVNDKKGYVTFKNVSFTYKGADTPAIDGLSFEAKPGEVTAIIGGTGMGKSTIINLIPRLYDVTSGEVLVDDINVKDYKLSDLREKIGFVPQKALLFKGTIDSNISFGGNNVNDIDVENAAKIAQSESFILSKEKGYEEPVAQGGTNFSGGQKQRLCIARAIVRKPEIYIFDDSFSALDLKTDKALREALKQTTGKDATTIIVAQRVSTILDANRIIVVDMGKVVGIGTHQELLRSCDVYKEIVASQMTSEEAQNG